MKLPLSIKAIENLPTPATGKETCFDTSTRYLAVIATAAGDKVYYYIRKLKQLRKIFSTFDEYRTGAPSSPARHFTENSAKNRAKEVTIPIADQSLTVLQETQA